MSRLTKETIAQLKEFVCYHRTLCDDAICRKEEGCFVNWVIEGLKELQHYKDLEEQGRLIELQQGQWMPFKLDTRGYVEIIHYECSNCHNVRGGQTMYCPNCGAKMGGRTNEN